MNDWISVKDRFPRLTKAQQQPNSFGVPVLIWPHFESPGATPSPIAFYGCRQTDKPSFYIYGRVIHHVTHWMPLPDAPTKDSGNG